MDMTVEVNGTMLLAERACRMVFGENADLGPVLPAPQALLDMLENWPGRGDAVHKVALELPMDFDIAHEMGKGERKGIVLVVHRVTILHQGKKVGYAIRTNQLGINALTLHRDAWLKFNRQIRQAH